MPAYNFQRQFVEPILSLEKPHTIRPERKNPTEVGDMLYLYTGMRTKKCKLIATSSCIDVKWIGIYIRPHSEPFVMLSGNVFSSFELRRLVRRDGFANEDDFFTFFLRYPREVREHDLRLILWDTKELVNCWEDQTVLNSSAPEDRRLNALWRCSDGRE